MRRQCVIGANVDKEGRLCGDVKVVQPAVFGGSTSATASVSGGAGLAREFSLRLASPWGSCDSDFEVLRKTQEESACGYASLCTQALLELGGFHASGCAWRLYGDWSLRDLDPKGGPTRYPSMQLQSERLRSLKTSVKLRTSWYTPRSQVRLSAEVAGPPGDVAFVRTEAQAELSMPLGRIWTLPWQGHASAACGLLFPAGRSCPQDRFHLGGASGLAALKGFAEHGAEPRAPCARRKDEDTAEDAQGGEAMASLFASASAPCRLLPVDGARLLCFLGCGVLRSNRAERLRASAGLGVAIPLGPGSLELTFAQPLRYSSHDVLQKWQLGLRLQLME